jgi:hypothetical protein
MGPRYFSLSCYVVGLLYTVRERKNFKGKSLFG